MNPLSPDEARHLEESHQRFLHMEIEAYYEDTRRYQETEIEIYNTKGEFSHSEIRPQTEHGN